MLRGLYAPTSSLPSHRFFFHQLIMEDIPSQVKTMLTYFNQSRLAYTVIMRLQFEEDLRLLGRAFIKPLVIQLSNS